MPEDMKPVHENDPMPFFCSPENSCFNECCKDLNQALTPYDILCLKRNLGLSSRETGETQEYFALIAEDHCKRFGKNTGLTVRQWFGLEMTLET